MRKPAKGVGRYILGILACQVVLLLAWSNLGADASATGYSSVQTLLDSIENTQPQGKAYLLLAKTAIHRSSQNVHILGTIVLVTSLAVIVLSIMIALRLRSKDFQNSDANRNA
jgi:hypothetical protein